MTTKKVEGEEGVLLDDMFNDETTKPESTWFTFEKVGDGIAGTLVMEPFEKEGNFGKQMIYVLETKEGKEINVGLNCQSKQILIRQLKSADVGDIIAFRYTGDVDVKKGNMAKNIDVRVRHINK